jgi:hypothetical protein
MMMTTTNLKQICSNSKILKDRKEGSGKENKEMMEVMVIPLEDWELRVQTSISAEDRFDCNSCGSSVDSLIATEETITDWFCSNIPSVFNGLLGRIDEDHISRDIWM